MFCSNCGKEINNNAKFCQYCGHGIDNQNNFIQNSNNIVDCSVCGKSFSNTKYKYCPYCTADYVPTDERVDNFHCGQYEKAQKEEKCIYSPYCTHYDCQYSKKQNTNSKNNGTNGFGTGCLIAIAIFFGLAILSGFIDLFSKDSRQNVAQNIEVQQKKEQIEDNTSSDNEEQERLQKTEKLIQDAKNGGLIIKFKQAFVGDMATKEPDVYICVVDEYVWNQLPYETKQQMVLLMDDYSKIKGWKIISFEGYRTGKSIINAMYAVKNF